MICEKCGKEFDEDWRRDPGTRKTPCRFCSKGCSNSRIKTEETKEKVSNSLYKFNGTKKKVCKLCNAKLNHMNKSGFCKDCKSPAKTRSECVSDWRRKKKIILLEYKGEKCEICGYNKFVGALEFHHKDPTKKDFAISCKNIKSIERCKKEVDKCILVCSNCHREIHGGLIDINAELV